MSDAFQARMAAREARKAALAAREEAQHEAELILLDDLEQELGDDAVRGVHTRSGLVVVRAPSRPVMAQWREKILKLAEGNAAGKAAASLNLARQCIVAVLAKGGKPERGTSAIDAFDAMCEAHPGIQDLIANEAIKLSGQLAEQEAGK
jgi:hypothetical protein